MTNTLKFTGRDAELEKIIESWCIASNIKNPNPQIVLLKGERGVGKTRLAFEFYRWLSENAEPKIGSSSYWPDAMAIYQNAINVNPHPRNCNFDIQIPYLWWGLHVSSSKNPIDTISSFDAYLAPHLAMLLASSIKQRKGLDLATALADLGVDVGISFIEDLTYLGLIKRLAEGAKKGVDIVRGGMGDVSIEKALQVPQSRAVSVLEQLENVFNPTQDCASTPGVILIDDAQNVDTEKDPAILAFIEQLIHYAVTQKWPMLILVTHWKRELSSEVTPQENSFAGILRHCLYGDPSENGLAAGIPGGFLDKTNFTEIDLGPVDDLSIALSEQLPGLTEEQSSGILQVTGGNPRFLQQVIQFAHENEGFFGDFDTSKPLSDAGYSELLLETKSQDIFRVVRRRLIDAPDEVKEAICLASLQGMRFANDLVKAIARAQIAKDVEIPLEKAEDPYSWVAGTKNKANDSVGTFVEHLFLQVAENVRPHVKSLGGESKLLLSFKDTIRRLLEDEHFRRSDAFETQLIAYSIAADLFVNSSVARERSLAQKAMSYIAMVHLRRSSLEAATAAYERLLKTPSHDGSNWILGTEWKDRIAILDFLTAAYRKLRWFSKLSSTYAKLLQYGFHLLNDQSQGIIKLSHDEEEIKKVFEMWKKELLDGIIQGGYFDDMDPKPDNKFVEKFIEKGYCDAIKVIVRSLLGIGELAVAWPLLKFNDSDDPIDEIPFTYVDSRGETLKGFEFYQISINIAYSISTLIDEQFGHYEHFKLLVDDIAQTYNDQHNPTKAIDVIERAIVIAEEMGDLILQIQAINDLGVVLGQKGDHKKSEETLLRAGKIYNDNYVGDSFSVVVLSNNGENEFRKEEDISSEHEQIIGKINVLTQFSSLFDSNPNEAVQQSRKLLSLAGDMESNLGINALETGELDKAEKWLKYAMERYTELNDGPKIAQTYENFGVITKRRGETETACNWWNRSISVYEELIEVDNENGRDILWNNAIRRLEETMQESGCEE